MKDFLKVISDLKKIEKKLKPSEVGCYNCTRWRARSFRCDKCVGFSEFKNIDTLNTELKEKGLDYLCAPSIEDLRRKNIDYIRSKRRKKMTNFERIKGMNVEELAEFFEDKVYSFGCDVCSSKYSRMDICEEPSCRNFVMKWLKEWLESECDTE